MELLTQMMQQETLVDVELVPEAILIDVRHFFNQPAL
jgi:hypothetical protein